MANDYLSTRIVTAWEATRYDVPGYVVKHQDGFSSWSPKEIFETASLPIGDVSKLPEWQQRLVAEYHQLAVRHAELKESMSMMSAIVLNESMLDIQFFHMDKYLYILRERLLKFGILSCD